LLEHPDILDAAVIGVKKEISSGETTEAPRAYIVRGSKALTESDIHDYMSEHVAAFKQLSGGIEFIEKIPKSAAGKILRKELTKMYEEKEKEKYI